MARYVNRPQQHRVYNMTPIHKVPAYLTHLDGIILVMDTYANNQLDFLHTYPYDGSQLPLAGGVFGRSNTDRAQVYINRTVKYII